MQVCYKRIQRTQCVITVLQHMITYTTRLQKSRRWAIRFADVFFIVIFVSHELSQHPRDRSLRNLQVVNKL